MGGKSQPETILALAPIRLHNLIPELLLHVATFLSQTDLLTLTLVNKHIKEVTEPELYREFVNREEYGRSIKPFILRILDRPELAKYVHRVRLGSLMQLGHFSTDDNYFELYEDLGCGEEEYQRLCEAAVDAGVIDQIVPFELENPIVKRINDPNSHARRDNVITGDLQNYLYDESIKTDEIPFDVQFCTLLHLGLDEAEAVLLMALLPDVREVYFWGVPEHRFSLPWRAKHGFRALRCLKASQSDNASDWAFPIFHGVMQSGNLQELMLHGLVTERETFHHPDISRTISLQPRSTNITCLVLEHCNLLRNDTETLLRACALLKSFFYSTRAEYHSLIDFTIQDMVDMLDDHKSSLEHLSLYMDVEWLFDGIPIPSPSFREFSTLQKLETNSVIWAYLLHDFQEEETRSWIESTDEMSDHLPSSLQQLVIRESLNHTRNEYWNHNQLSSLILQRNTKLPNLKDLVLVHLDGQMSQSRYEELSTMVVRAVQRGFCFSLAPRSQYSKAYPTPFASAGDESLYPIFGQPWYVNLGDGRQE